MVDRPERRRVSFERLMQAPAAASHDQAFVLLASTLNGVEDEMSGVPFAPHAWMTDGRMYPPLVDSLVAPTPESAGRFHEYKNRRHRTIIGLNGAIRIIAGRDKSVELDKPGRDGRTVDQL